MALTPIVNDLRKYYNWKWSFFPEKAILQNGTRQYTFFPLENKMGKSDFDTFVRKISLSLKTVQSLCQLQFFLEGENQI